MAGRCIEEGQRRLEIELVFAAARLRLVEKNALGLQVRDCVAPTSHRRPRGGDPRVASKHPGVQVAWFEHDVDAPDFLSFVEKPNLVLLGGRMSTGRQSADLAASNDMRLELSKAAEDPGKTLSGDSDLDVPVHPSLSAAPNIKRPAAYN